MSTDLVHHEHTTEVTAPPTPVEWRALQEQADVISRSGLAPSSVDTPEKVLVIALKGRELRIPPMQALSHINVIDGKPTLSAELMTALVRRAGHKLRIEETNDQKCTVEAVRADDPDHPTRVTFTIAEAERAGLLTLVDGQPRARSRSGKPLPWEAHTSTMLRWRAISACCRAVFPDVLMGASYTPEELGAQVDPDTGEVIDLRPDDYRDPVWVALLDELEDLLDQADAAGVEGDAEKAREYARISQEHAVKAVETVRAKLPADDAEEPEPPAEDDGEDVVDAEIVDEPEATADDGWDAEGPTEDPEPYDWRADLKAAGLTVVKLLTTLRKDWPHNDQYNKPNRSVDIDRLVNDLDMGDVVKATIDDLKGAA